MYNLRYHVASLAAVFLALTVGIILGTAIADRAGLDKRQQQLLLSVQQEFEALRAENQRLAQQIKAGDALQAEAARRFVRGKLTGERVLIVVEGSGLPEGGRDLVARLVEAGAQAQVLTIRQPGWGLADPRVVSRVSQAIGPSQGATAALARAVESTLPAELVQTGGGSVVRALIESGVASLEPAEAAPATAVVLFSGGADGGIRDLIALGRRFEDLKVPAVGVERSDAEPSVVASFRDAGIPSVDNVERPIGQLSVVLVLSGAGRGHYGAKATATAPMPPLGPGG